MGSASKAESPSRNNRNIGQDLSAQAFGHLTASGVRYAKKENSFHCAERVLIRSNYAQQLRSCVLAGTQHGSSFALLAKGTQQAEDSGCVRSSSPYTGTEPSE